MKYLALVFFYALPVLAVVPEGSQVVRVSHSRATGDDIMVGDDKLSVKTATGGGFDKYDVTASMISSTWGVAHGAQVTFGLTYSQLDTGTSDVGGVSEVQAQYLKSIYAHHGFSIDAGLGFRTPGNGRPATKFDSYNDGHQKYDYVLNLSYSFGPRFSVMLHNRFTDRSGADAKSQRLHEFVAKYSFIESTSVSAFYHRFDTRDGEDIGATTFDNVKEKWGAYGLTVAHTLRSDMSLDLSYFTKPKSGAENTNLISGFILGANYIF